MEVISHFQLTTKDIAEGNQLESRKHEILGKVVEITNLFGKFERDEKITAWEKLKKAWSALEERTDEEIEKFKKLG